MVTKKELVIEMKKKGIPNVNELMTKTELALIYKKWKKQQEQKEKDKEDTKKAKAVRKEAPVKKVRVKRQGNKLIVPEQYIEIDADDVLAESVRGDKIVVIFKEGGKIFYDKKTNKRII